MNTIVEILALASVLILTFIMYFKVQDIKWDIKDLRSQVLGNRKLIEDVLKVVDKPKRPYLIPSEKTRWRHYNGNEYEVMYIANEHSERPDDFPMTVVYRGKDGRIWSRPLNEWLDRFTPIP